MNCERLIAVAHGEQPADLVFKNARIVNVFTGSIEEAGVAVAEGCIAGFGDYADAAEVIDLSGKLLAPTFIDPHIHLESTMLTPAEFARLVLPRGTTATVSDPHEIANVMGLEGIKLMLDTSEGLPFDFFFTLSSCVPATTMETSGASLGASDLETLIDHPRILALAEMMNFPGVIYRDPDVMAKLALAHQHAMIIDGHAPLLSGSDLNAYIAGGIRSEHECTQLSEAHEKLAKGMWIFLRQGTTEKNLLELLPLVNETTASRCCFASDDLHPPDILAEGHINASVRLAIEHGLEPVTAIRMASLNPATYFRLDFRGAIAPGYLADMQVLSDLADSLLAPLAVYKEGKLVAAEGELRVDLTAPAVAGRAVQTVKLERELAPDDFRVKRDGAKLRAIRVIRGQIVTAAEEVDVGDAAFVESRPDEDLLKLVVVERHTGRGGHATGFVRGFGFKRGAIASSVAHDSHNLICVGVSDADIALALNHLARMQGGFVVVSDGEVRAALPLPLAGLMSLQSGREVASELDALLAVSHDELGGALANPFMALSFLALPVIPQLKLTDRGLVDVDKFEIVPLFLR